MGTNDDTLTWVAVCPYDRIPVDRGVAALVDGIPVALFRLSDGGLFAVDHLDPATGMPVIARGLVGSVGDAPIVSSPLHKQIFDLRDGSCVDDPSLRLRTFPVKAIDGVVHVAAPPAASR